MRRQLHMLDKDLTIRLLSSLERDVAEHGFIVVHSRIHGRLRCHDDVAAELEVGLHDLDAIEHRRALRDLLLELRCTLLEKRLENRPAIRTRGFP